MTEPELQKLHKKVAAVHALVEKFEMLDGHDRHRFGEHYMQHLREIVDTDDYLPARVDEWMRRQGDGEEIELVARSLADGTPMHRGTFVGYAFMPTVMLDVGDGEFRNWPVIGVEEDGI